MSEFLILMLSQLVMAVIIFVIFSILKREERHKKSSYNEEDGIPKNNFESELSENEKKKLPLKMEAALGLTMQKAEANQVKRALNYMIVAIESERIRNQKEGNAYKAEELNKYRSLIELYRDAAAKGLSLKQNSPLFCIIDVRKIENVGMLFIGYLLGGSLRVEDNVILKDETGCEIYTTIESLMHDGQITDKIYSDETAGIVLKDICTNQLKERKIILLNEYKNK